MRTKKGPLWETKPKAVVAGIRKGIPTNINSAEILGTVTRLHPAVTKNAGRPITMISVVTLSPYVTVEGKRQQRTNHHSVMITGERAKEVIQTMQPGVAVHVRGSLETEKPAKREDGTWQNGRTFIVAKTIELVTPSEGQEGEEHDEAKQEVEESPRNDRDGGEGDDPQREEQLPKQ